MNINHKKPRRCNRKASIVPILLIGLLTLGLFVFVILNYFIDSSSGSMLTVEPILASVERGEFVAQVLDQGEIQSSENVEIRCEARARNGAITVIEVVAEGSRVYGGDFLVRLDSSAFEKELETQKIAVASSQTIVIQAKAELNTAIESLKEYEQGIFVERNKLIENDIYDSKSLIETAKQELTQAKAVLGHSKKLQGKGFITSQQLAADGFEVKRAEFSLKTANNKLELAEKQLEVLNEITRIKETVQLKSDIEAANVKLANQKESLSVEENKLEEINIQIAKCVIRVPDGVQGQVVYAKESSRGGNDWVLEEGASVRERQVLIRLPDPDKMEVKALINEQSITQIRVGMPASINVDALTNQTLSGIVTKVNQYAESSGWMSSSVRKYAVLVEILDPPPALKPGMNAAVTIEVRYEADAIKAPIQTVYAVQDRHFCLLKRGENDWETREVEVDGDNSQVVLVNKGLQPGDQLVMNPGAFKELMDLPELELDQKIQISDRMKSKINALKNGPAENTKQLVRAETKPVMKNEQQPNSSGGRSQGMTGGGGSSGFIMPTSAAVLIKDKDKDGDGKLTKEEIGAPFSFFFARIDTDQDGFLSEEEADKSIQRMKNRMRQGGGVEGGPRL